MSALREFMDVSGFPNNPADWVVSDLSLGTWRGHQVARDFLLQLGCDSTLNETVYPGLSEQGAALDDSRKAAMFGPLVDAETRGNIGMSTALNLAQRVLASCIWDSRGQFFAAAAEAMRRILVESARKKKRQRHAARRGQRPNSASRPRASQGGTGGASWHEASEMWMTC
jgi:hypothetical protein